MARKFGFSLDQHREAGRELKRIERWLCVLEVAVARSYSTAFSDAITRIRARIGVIKSKLDGRLAHELQDAFSPEVYYGDDNDDMLPDERVHVGSVLDSPRFISAKALLDSMIFDGKCDGGVILHNTMRFDVHLAHIQPMIDEGDFSVEETAELIRKAIIEIIEHKAGKGLDGVAIPGGADGLPVRNTAMLHRERISCDLS